MYNCLYILLYSQYIILLCTVSLYIVHSSFHSMLSITTRFCTDLQLRGGARAIVRLGLIVTVWSPSARSENVKGEEPTCTYNVCIWRDRHYKNLISYFITSQIHRYWNLSYLEMTLKIELHLEQMGAKRCTKFIFKKLLTRKKSAHHTVSVCLINAITKSSVELCKDIVKCF